MSGRRSLTRGVSRASGKGARTLSNPSPGRRALIAAASVSLALASLATTVATADATPARSVAAAAPAADRVSEPKSFSDDFATKQQRRQDDLRQQALQAQAAAASSSLRVTSSGCATARRSTSISRRPTGSSWSSWSSATSSSPTLTVAQQVPRSAAGRQRDRRDGPAARRDPGAEPLDRQQHLVAGGLRPSPLRGHVLRTHEGVLRDPVLGSLHHRRRRHRVGEGAVQRGSLRAQLVRQHRLQQPARRWCATRSRSGSSQPARRRDDDGSDQRATWRPSTRRTAYDINGDGNLEEPDGVIDHFQIVHAGGDEAAGDPNQGTDAIWSHRSGAALQVGGPLGVGVNVGDNGVASEQPGRQRQDPQQPDRHVGLRLHRAARERRARGVRPRVRPRPRSARSLRHLGQHRRRREQHGVLDPDVLGREHRRRRLLRHRRRPDRHGRLGADVARLAGAPGQEGAVLREGAFR